MFSNPTARYALRALLVGVAAFVSAWYAGDWKDGLYAGVVALASYAGLGAAVPAVEPHVGRKLKA